MTIARVHLKIVFFSSIFAIIIYVGKIKEEGKQENEKKKKEVTLILAGLLAPTIQPNVNGMVLLKLP